MRILSMFIIVLLLLFGGIYFVAFTQTGNNILKPYLEDFASKKIQKDVNIEKFTLNMNHISIEASVSNEAKMMLDGDINLFKQWFDLIYQIHAQNLKTPVITIRDNLEVHGNIKGDINNLAIQGAGKAFDSNLDFNVRLLNQKPLSGSINAIGINTGKVLELIGKPAYTKGKVDIIAKIQDKNNILSGGADIKIHKSDIDEQLVKRDFNVSIPKDISYTGSIKGDVKGDTLKANSKIKSSLATFKTINTNINLKTTDIISDFSLNIADLQNLEFLTGKKLIGSLLINGDIQKKKNDLLVNAKSDIFDGEFTAKLNNNKAEVNGENFQIKKILAMLGEPAIAYGLVNFNAIVDDINAKDLNAKLNLLIDNGEIVGSLLRNKFDLDFPAVTNFSASSEAKLSNNNIEAKTDFKSSLLDVNAQKTTFNLLTHGLKSDFNLNAKDLASIGKLAKQDLKGEFSLKGNGEFVNNVLIFDANTNSLGGNIDINMKQNSFNASLKDVSVEKIVSILNKPQIAKGSMNAVAKFDNINTKHLNGTFNYTLNNGLLLGKGLKEFASIDFPESSPFAIKSDIVIKDGFANFTNSINSELASIPNFKGSFDLKKNELKSAYSIDIKELSKLAFLTKQTLYGPFQANGIVDFVDNDLKATADAPLLGGQSRTVFEKGILLSQAQQISIKGLSSFLGLPYVFDSKGDFNLKYNTRNEKGDYILNMKEGRLVENQLSSLIKTFANKDITQEVYKDTVLKGEIDKEKVTYLLDLNGTKTSLHIPNGILNTATKMTNANFSLKIEKTDIDGSISGSIDDPKVNIDSSKYLQQKAKKKIDKELDKHLKGTNKEIVKDLLKLF